MLDQKPSLEDMLAMYQTFSKVTLTNLKKVRNNLHLKKWQYMFCLTQLKFQFKTSVTEWDIDRKADGWSHYIPFIKMWHAREYFDNVIQFKKYLVVI